MRHNQAASVEHPIAIEPVKAFRDVPCDRIVMTTREPAETVITQLRSYGVKQEKIST